MAFKEGNFVQRVHQTEATDWMKFNPGNEVVRISEILADGRLLVRNKRGEDYKISLTPQLFELRGNPLKIQLPYPELLDLMPAGIKWGSTTKYSQLNNERNNMQGNKMKRTVTKVNKITYEFSERDIRKALAESAGLSQDKVENIVLHVKAGKVVGASYTEEDVCSSQN